MLKANRAVGLIVTIAALLVATSGTVPTGASTWSTYLPNPQTLANVDHCTIAGFCGQFDTPAYSPYTAVPSVDLYQNSPPFANPQPSDFVICLDNQISTDFCRDLHNASDSTLQNLLADEYQGIQAALPNGTVVQIGDGSIGEMVLYQFVLAHSGSATTAAQVKAELALAESYDSQTTSLMSSIQSYINGNQSSGGTCTKWYKGTLAPSNPTLTAAQMNQQIACYAYWELEQYNDLYQASLTFYGSTTMKCMGGNLNNDACRNYITKVSWTDAESLDQTPGAVGWSSFYNWINQHNPVDGDSGPGASDW